MMYSLGVLCLLSAAVAFPTTEQLHTNMQALLPHPELTSEEKDNSSDLLVVHGPIQPPLDEPESEEIKHPSEFEERPEAEKDPDKLDDVIEVIQTESKESKESKDSKEISKEAKESKESEDLSESKEFEKRPGEPTEGNKEKDSKSEESKGGDEEDGPIIVQVIQKPPKKGFILDWLPFSNFHLPWPFSYSTSNLRNDGQRLQPVYIIRESDFAFNDI